MNRLRVQLMKVKTRFLAWREGLSPETAQKLALGISVVISILIAAAWFFSLVSDSFDLTTTEISDLDTKHIKTIVEESQKSVQERVKVETEIGALPLSK